MGKYFVIITAFILFISLNDSSAQCSDAGVCQLGFSHEEKASKKFDAELSYSFGASKKEDDVKFNSVSFTMSYQPFSNTKFTAIVPYNSQSGPLGDISGIGDIILSFTQNIYQHKKQSVSLTLGAKLETGDDNKDELPQIYQSGLGSNDMLIGINYSAKNVLFGIGYQVAGSRNNNILKLERGDDFIARSSYTFDFDKFNVTPQLLFIKRIGESSILDITSPELNKYAKIKDSDQTQINFLISSSYSLNKSVQILAEVALPFLERDVNVDGLTRSFTAGIGFRYRF